jgi:hypothetical protein
MTTYTRMPRPRPREPALHGHYAPGAPVYDVRDLGAADADNPTVVEFGLSPLRVTVPLTDAERQREAWMWGLAMVAGAAGVLYFGGSWLKDLVRELRS